MFFVFFKQQTSSGMRISDWSSDVCSSDLKGAAKPEARLPPFRHGGAYSLAIEAAIACIDQNMQANMGSRRIRLQLAQSLLVDFGRAVEEINLRARAFGTLGQILHAGDERRDRKSVV